MFNKKNKIVPECKAKEMRRTKESEDLHKFFKSKVTVKTGDRTYITTFYAVPAPHKKCSIL